MNLAAHSESWKLKTPFTISRGTRTHAEVVVVTLEEGGISGRGECTPYARYGESVRGTLLELEAAAQRLHQGTSPETLLTQLPPGATRNALDCAWWDFQAKKAGRTVAELLKRPPLTALTTAFTLSLAEPAVMEKQARAEADRPLLKIKTGGVDVANIVAAVRHGAPESRLIVDANEAWREDEVEKILAALAKLGVALVEQPLPAGSDMILEKIHRAVPVFADESFHTSSELEALLPRYDGVNIKLDKTGGLTEALHAFAAAREHRLSVMCGCMLGTSLAMAPMMIVAQGADAVDLDAPLLLAEDRPHAIRYDGSRMQPFDTELWG